MSSFDTAREQWENYHMDRIRNAKEAAENGDPEAMEIMASSIWCIQYNCRDEVIALLTAASDKGNGRASWKLADLYANRNEAEYDEKIEFYCRRALSDGKIYSSRNEDDCLSHSVFHWVDRHHPEWQEMEEGFHSDDRYYLCPTGRYMMNAFRGIGKEAAMEERRKKREADNDASPGAK